MLYSVKITKLWREGNTWHGEAHVQGPGEPIIVRASAPIPSLQHTAKVVQRARVAGADIPLVYDVVPRAFSGTIVGCDQVGGFNPLKTLKKAANSIAKSKVIKKLGSAVKSVVKSNITASVMGAVAVAFPPVGVPAAAAYATARSTLELAEKGAKIAKAGKKVATAVAKLPAPQKAKALQTIAAAKQAQQVVASVVKGAVQGKPDAVKWAKAFAVAKQSKAQMEKIAHATAQQQQTKGVLVLPSGEILAGAFRASDVRRV